MGNSKILVVDSDGGVLNYKDATKHLLSCYPFMHLGEYVEATDRVEDSDFIFPMITQYMGVCPRYDEIIKTDLYKHYGDRFVFYTLDDLPECLHEDSIGMKFTAMPMKNHEENLESNVIMIPLVDDKILFADEEKITEYRTIDREYEYVFVGGIGTSGPKSVRTQRDFVLNFAERGDSLVVDTTKDKSIFHVKKDWKIEKFQREYMEKLAKGKFGFCPVGQGLNSYRIGECMRIGVVPIIVGHKCFPLESHIDWNECALIFETQDEVTDENISAQLGNRNHKEMGKLCIEVWEKYFRPENLCKFLYKEFLLNETIT